MERHASGCSPRGRDARDRGAVAVEFALLFPLLFVLLFGTLLVGWRVWEAQAGQSVARDAARLAGFGVTDAGSYAHTVICLAEQDGLRAGSVTSVGISFLDRTLGNGAQAAVGGYVKVTLTYRSALGAVPLLGSRDGTITASAVTRIEQPPLPGALVIDTIVTEGGSRCR
jgi:TadE-like protein